MGSNQTGLQITADVIRGGIEPRFREGPRTIHITREKKQQAIDAEAQLRELIVNTRGYSAYQDLLKIRRDIAKERKEREKQKRIEAEEFRQNLETGLILFIVFILIIGLALAAINFKGYI